MILNSFRATSLLFRRSFSTSSRLPNPILYAKGPITSSLSRVPVIQTPLLARSVASQVSGRPGSQTFEHAATNIREEVGNSTADLAKAIAGSNVYDDAVEPTQRTFVSSHVVLHNATHVVGYLAGYH